MTGGPAVQDFFWASVLPTPMENVKLVSKRKKAVPGRVSKDHMRARGWQAQSMELAPDG